MSKLCYLLSCRRKYFSETSLNLYQVPGRHIQRNDSLRRHLLKNLNDFANVTQTFVNIASLRRTGFYSRRERRCLQDHCLCDAHGYHEVQAERWRGTGWGRRYGGKCPNTPYPTTHPPVTHAHVLWNLNAAILYKDCDVMSLGEWCLTFAEMVALVRTQNFFSGDRIMNLRLYTCIICLIFKYYDVKVMLL